MVEESVVRGLGVSVMGGFGTGEVFTESFLCVGASILHGFLVVGNAHVLTSLVELEASDVATGVQRSLFFLQGDFDDYLVRLVYQLERSGWSLLPTCSCGSATLGLGGSLSSSDLEFPVIHEAPDSLLSVDVMVSGHLFMPVLSTSTKHVVFDMLLKTAPKIYDSSPGRKSASSSGLRLPTARNTRRYLQEMECNFLFFEGCLCKFAAVITKL
jgi:hypothetical protein